MEAFMGRRNGYYKLVTAQLLIIFFLLCIVPAGVVFLSSKKKIAENSVSNLENFAQVTAEHRSAVISQFLENKTDLLNTLVTLYPEDFFYNPEKLDGLFLAISKNGDIVDLQVIDATGRQHGYVGPYRNQIEGKSYDQAAWFQETLIKGVHISDLFTGFRNVPHFVVAVTDPLKHFVLRATINSSMFNSLLLSAKPGPNGDAYLVNREGELQTPSLQKMFALSDFEKKLISFDGSKSSTITKDYVYVTRWIENHQWLLVIKASIDDASGLYHSIRDHIILVSFISSLLAMAVATVAGFVLTRRLERAEKQKTVSRMQFAHMEKMAAVGRLAAGIAHEINNPLQLITNQAGWLSELLTEETPDKCKNLGEYQEAAEQIKKHVRRAGTITHRLLGFSRKISDQQKKEDINDLLVETVSLIEKETEYQNIRVNCKLAKDLPFIDTDGPQLQQVFLNIINNSIDAIGQNGEVEIITAQVKDQIVIRFLDSGTGIKPSDINHIFDPFFTTKEVGKGTGLGLYISYDIIKKLGGSLKAQNRVAGGAEFIISLPFEPAKNSTRVGGGLAANQDKQEKGD